MPGHRWTELSLLALDGNARLWHLDGRLIDPVECLTITRTHLRGWLYQCWRAAPPPAPPLPPRADLNMAPLIRGHIAPLLFRRLQRSPFARSRWARVLAEQYYQACLDEARRLSLLRYLVEVPRKSGVEPVLVKGEAVACLYPVSALRPYGDVDLCVEPARFTEAEQTYRRAAMPVGVLDLHRGIADLDDRTWDQVIQRTRLLTLPGKTAFHVRVLGPEDQLRQLCLHFWRHLGMKPIWLVDIACALEAAGPDFDWDYLLHGDRVRTDWVRCTLGLAQALLGAECAHEPLRREADRVPDWLAPAVQWRWEVGPKLPTLRHYWRHPRQFPDALRYQWFSPLRATTRVHQPARRPYAVLQVLASLQRPRQAAIKIHRRLSRRVARNDVRFDIHQERMY